MSSVAFILSSAYVVPGLIAEYGKIPPSFIPLGASRLYAHQVEALSPHVDKVVLSLPGDFFVPLADKTALERSEVAVEPVPHNHSIGEVVAQLIQKYAADFKRVVILYGDTLVTDLEGLSPDQVSVHRVDDQYQWALASEFLSTSDQAEPDEVLSGLFSFSQPVELAQAIRSNDGDFLKALKLYSEERKLEPLRRPAWYDFGHVQTYFRSRALFSTARSFNEVRFSQGFVHKSSENHEKILAEAQWFENLPPKLRMYTPAYLGTFEHDGRYGYATELTGLSSLSDLAVFGQLDTRVWTRVFDACGEFLQASQATQANCDTFEGLSEYYLPKTYKRLIEFKNQNIFDIEKDFKVNGSTLPSLMKIAQYSQDIIEKSCPVSLSLIHGDFCFSNIFFDFRKDIVKVIDPRGALPSGERSLYGDPRYDLAKLAHSAEAGYDLVIAGRLPLTVADSEINIELSALSDVAWRAMLHAYESAQLWSPLTDRKTITAILVHLFLSMLPLHSDEPARQLAFIALAGLQFQKLER